MSEQEGRVDAPGHWADGTTQKLRMSQNRGLLVETGLPKYTDLAYHRRIFAANTGAGTAKAPVADLPTTTAIWGLYNGYEDGTHLVILKMTCDSVSGTLGLGLSMLGCVCPTPQAAAATVYASSVMAPVSGGGVKSKAIFANAVTLASAPVWITIASGDQVASISVGSGHVANIDGLFVVPPRHVCGLNVLAPTGTAALLSAGFVWAEVQFTKL